MRQKQRGVIPQEFQAALPPGILWQPDHVGGSLGFGGKPEYETIWDKLEADAEAMIPPDALGVPGAGTDLRQDLTNFLFQATAASQLVVPFNRSRIYLMLENIGAANVFVAFGKPATTQDSFRIAGGGGFYEPILGTVSSVHMISAAGTQSVIVVEGFRAA